MDFIKIMIFLKSIACSCERVLYFNVFFVCPMVSNQWNPWLLSKFFKIPPNSDHQPLMFITIIIFFKLNWMLTGECHISRFSQKSFQSLHFTGIHGKSSTYWYRIMDFINIMILLKFIECSWGGVIFQGFQKCQSHGLKINEIHNCCHNSSKWSKGQTTNHGFSSQSWCSWNPIRFIKQRFGVATFLYSWSTFVQNSQECPIESDSDPIDS